MAEIQFNICRLLEIRMEHESIAKWTDFFSQIPKDEHTKHSSYINTLAILRTECGGNIQAPRQLFVARLPSDCDFVDPVTFNGGAITRAERIAVLQSLNCYKPLRVVHGMRSTYFCFNELCVFIVQLK
jgi:hypothetical protein